LAVGDHWPCGLAGWRAARRLQRDREYGLLVDPGEQILRHFDGDRPAGIDQSKRMRLVARRDEPELHRLLLLGAEQRGRGDNQRAVARIDGGDETGLAAFGTELRDERRTWRGDGADIDQRRKTRRG